MTNRGYRAKIVFAPLIGLSIFAASAAGVMGGLANKAMAGEYDWTGLYGGLHAGGVWGNVIVTDDVNDGVPPGPFPYSAAGAFGGGTAGLNWQMGSIVTGIEGDLGYMALSGAGIVPSSRAWTHKL
jgi:hypothetical protein